MSDNQETKKARVGPQESDIIGWYLMYWQKGQFTVCFRPGGSFYVKEDTARCAATWQILDGEILIDWQKYGRYILSDDPGEPVKTLKGNAISKKENDWRKAIRRSGLTDVEKLLFGEGEGTEWEVKDQDGKKLFSLEFRCDGMNHVVCDQLKGDAHWSLKKNNKTIIIDGGKNFQYELDIDAKKKTMDGFVSPPDVKDPDDDPMCERTMEFKKNLVQPKALDHHDHSKGDDDDGDGGHGHGHSHGHDGHGHSHGEGHGEGHDYGGGIVSLGNLTIASDKFMVDREFQVDKGFETEFGVERVPPGKVEGLTAWLQDGKGTRISDEVEGEEHGGHLHFKMMPKAADAQTFAIKCMDQVSTISVHPGAAPANDGVMAVLEDADGKHVGFIELKLHDDAGDLELWITDAKSEPLDFPADTTVTVTFPTHDNRSVTLSVRDHDKNEDEDGNENMRDGKTNYFIFPGESEQDPAFLIGEEFRSTTTVTFTSEKKAYVAPPFVLVPHQH